MMKWNEDDLKQAVITFFEGLLHLRPDEKLLIYVDRGSCEYTAKMFQDCARDIDAHPEIFHLDSRMTLPEMAENLTEKIRTGNFDVICELSEQYFYQTSAWKLASAMGGRAYSLAGLDRDAFIRCIGKVDHDAMFQFGETLKGILAGSDVIEIHTDKGTTITMKMTVNAAEKFVRRLRGKVTGKNIHLSGITHQQSGRFTKTRKLSFMGGQIAFNGVRDTIEGNAVIDGYLWPPDEIGQLKDTVALTVKRGNVINISGASRESKLLGQWLDGKQKGIMHFCIGFNPGAQWSGKILEVERVFGSISMGVSQYPYHTDGIMKNPTIRINDDILLRDGRFEHEQLVELQKKLLLGMA